jgi:ATP:cob(I)alamin adenosyltransferase
LEDWIDDMDGNLPALKAFILPGGGLASAHLHMARSCCRRAERRLVPLVADGELEPEVAMYLNRLSDFLFQSARYAANSEGTADVLWIPAAKPISD